DLSARLGEVRVLSLVLHRRDMAGLDVEVARAFAGRIPEARLAVLDGAWPALWFEDRAAAVRLLVDFFTNRRPDESAQPLADSALGRRLAALSGREREVLSLVAGGESNAEIAQRLGLSIHTVERHLANIYRKIDARGRADATAFAFRSGL